MVAWDSRVLSGAVGGGVSGRARGETRLWNCLEQDVHRSRLCWICFPQLHDLKRTGTICVDAMVVWWYVWWWGMCRRKLRLKRRSAV